MSRAAPRPQLHVLACTALYFSPLSRAICSGMSTVCPHHTHTHTPSLPVHHFPLISTDSSQIPFRSTSGLPWGLITHLHKQSSVSKHKFGAPNARLGPEPGIRMEGWGLKQIIRKPASLSPLPLWKVGQTQGLKLDLAIRFGQDERGTAKTGNKKKL